MTTKPKRKTPWNWLTFLNRAVKKEPSQRQSERAMNRASGWPTCACGQLCKKLPRSETGLPTDELLRDYGTSFTMHIGRQNWQAALDEFKEIEARTAELLGKK